MFSKKFLAPLLFFSINSLLFAQIKAPQIIPLSPNAAGLWKYTELPVNLYTGIPSISIPLYEIKSGNLKVPVSLSYHAGGIRYEEQASWVGLGWTLQAGGAVNRNIKGVADEKVEGILNQTTPLNQNVQACDYSTLDGVIKKYTDVKPDEFSYSMPGKSGHFIFQPGVEQPITMPYEPIKVNVTQSNIGTFKILDENGTKFTFGVQEATSGGDGVFVAELFPSTWLLTKMESADLAKNIIFNYVGGEAAVQKLTKTDRIDILDYVYGSANQNSPCQLPSPYFNNSQSTSLNYYTATSYLSEIFFENGKIEFAQSSTYRTDIYEKQRSLEFIRIYSLQGATYTLVKTIKFFYTYFKRNYHDVLQDWKLKLDKIQVVGADGITQDEYSFQYHTNNFSGDKYYPNDVNAQDFWGFYNGETNNQNLIPQQTIGYNPIGGGETQWQVGSIRTVNPLYMTEGVLKRITYPTGGYTEYDFETNKIEELNQTVYTGGLRVKKIESKASAASIPMVKTYRYGINNSGFGYKNFMRYLGFFSTESRYHCFNDLMVVGDVRYRIRTYNSTSSMQSDGYDGSPVVYPYVTEYSGDETNNNGRTEYVFDNGVPQSDNYYTLYYSASNTMERQSNHWNRGKLTRQTIYSSTNTKISETVNTYQTLHYFDQIVGMIAEQRYFYPVTELTGCYTYDGQTKYSHNYYPFRSGAIRPLQTIETLFDPSNSSREIVTTTNHSFDSDYLLPISKEQSVKKGDNNYEEKITDYTKFPFQYSFTGTPSGSEATGIKYLQDKRILNASIEQYRVKSIINNGSTVSKIIAGTLNTYKTNVPYLDKQWQLETGAAIPSSSFGSGSSLVSNSFVKYGDYKPKINFDTYDNLGNILTLHKESDIDKVYIWGYNNTCPVAEVTGITYGNATAPLNQAIIQNPSSDLALRNELNKIRQNYPASHVTTYTYKPLVGMTSQTDPNGKTIFYEYDGIGRLSLIKDQNQNILQRFCYNYQGQQTSCGGGIGNDVKTASFVKDCSVGTGSTVVYTVPANTYFSTSTIAANQLAQSDVDNNGQQYANTQGTCTGTQQNIFARLEVAYTYSDNTTGYSYYYNADESLYYQWVSVHLRFYSDAACTQPYNIPNNISYSIDAYGWIETESSFNNTSTLYQGSALAGTNEVFLDDVLPFETFYAVYGSGEYIVLEKTRDDYSIGSIGGGCIIRPAIYPAHTQGF